jgi:hypothetical protein
MMPADEYNPELEEAIECLKSPDFIPPDSAPAQVEFDGPVHFRLPTPRPCEFAENKDLIRDHLSTLFSDGPNTIRISHKSAPQLHLLHLRFK